MIGQVFSLDGGGDRSVVEWPGLTPSSFSSYSIFPPDEAPVSVSSKYLCCIFVFQQVVDGLYAKGEGNLHGGRMLK